MSLANASKAVVGTLILLTATGFTNGGYATPNVKDNNSFPVDSSSTSQKATISKLPLRFEENRGPSANEIKYSARGAGYGLYFGQQEAVFVLNQVHSSDLRNAAPAQSPSVVRMRWKGANPKTTISGVGHVEGVSNYLIGNDRSHWRRNVPASEKVRYKQVYKDIDLVFYGTENQLEYDFVVAPGADPSLIRMAFQGVDSLNVDAAGNLILGVGNEKLVQRAPVVYQEVDGVRRTIAGGYVVKPNHEVTFKLAAYDAAQKLVIDPVLMYSSYIGGNQDDIAKAVAVDGSGNVYITGYTYSADFPVTTGSYRDTCSTCNATDYKSDAFVVKISANGERVYSTYVGEDNTSDKGYAIAVDSNRAVYVTGETYYPGSGATFPIINGFTDPTTASGGGFVFKLNPDGSDLEYSTILQSASSTLGYAIALNGDDQVFVAGMAVANASFPRWPTAGTFNTLIGAGGTYQAFVVKINTSSSGAASLSYATRFGGTGTNYAYGIAVDTDGYAYVTGYTNTTDFPSTSGSYNELGDGSTREDAFVSKLAADGSSMVYSTYLGGAADDRGYAIALDSANKAYIAGYTTSDDFPTSDVTYNSSRNGLIDAFVAVMGSDGTGLVYGTYLGGSSSDDLATGIAIDAGGNFTVVGHSFSNDFPQLNSLNANVVGAEGFVTRFNATGDGLLFSTLLGGTGNTSGGDKIFSVAVDSFRNVYVVGQTDSADFPTQNPIQADHGGGSFDGFVAKITDVDLVVSISDNPDPVATTSALTYTVEVTNQGSSRATNVGVTINLPGSVALVVPANPSQGACDTQLNCGLEFLEPSASATIMVSVTTGQASEVISLSAQATSDEPDNNSINNSDTETTTVGNGGNTNVDLSVNISDSPDPVTLSSTLTYAIVVANHGTTQATNVVAAINLPASVTLNSISPQGLCNTQISCNLGTLAPSASTTISIAVTTGAMSGNITLSATASSAQTDVNSTDNSDSETTTVEAAGNTGNNPSTEENSGGALTLPLLFVLLVNALLRRKLVKLVVAK